VSPTPGATSSKEAKKREARARNRAARIVAKQSAAKEDATPKAVPGPTPGAVATAMAAVYDPPSTPPKRLALPTSLLEATPLLTADILKVVTDSLAQETVPAAFDQKDPDAALAKAIGERGPVAKIAKKSEVEANISKFKAVVATLQGGGEECADLLKAAQANLDTAVAQLSKISKDTPSPTHEHKALLEVRSAHEANTQARRDREQKGVAKAAERLQERHQHLAELRGARSMRWRRA